MSDMSLRARIRWPADRFRRPTTRPANGICACGPNSDRKVAAGRAAGSEGQWSIEMITIRGISFEENLKNDMGLEFYDLSHPWGLGQPCWPYFEDVKIERLHSMAKSGVLTQRITTVMHSGTHVDAPGHVVEGTPFMDEVPLPHFFGTGVVVSIPKKKWEVITADDLERARPQIRPGDIAIVN